MANEKNGSPFRRTARRKPTRAEGSLDLGEQISALRQLMARLDGMADQETAFAELVDFMEKYSRSSTRLAKLLREQRALSDELDAGAALSQALEGALEEMEALQRRK